MGQSSIPQPLTYLIGTRPKSNLKIPNQNQKRQQQLALVVTRVASPSVKPNGSPVHSSKARSPRQNLAEPEEVSPHTLPHALLKSAQEHHTGVWIGYAEADGSTSTQIVEPIRMGDGTMTAFDHGSANVRTFAISRISGIAPAQMNEINN